jgi:carboxylesterase type B
LLIEASQRVSESGTYGSWAFLPVTDGVLIQSAPSQALLKRRVNGINQLSGNNAEEGPYFTPQNITTEQDLVAWVKVLFPLFGDDDISKLLYYYPTQSSTNSSSLPRFASSGTTEPTALDVGSVARGQQQRANLIYGETVFVCPSYWAAEAYNTHGRLGYKYQFSVPLAIHGADQYPFFGTPLPNQSPEFTLAFQTIWGNFIKTGNPSIPSSIANGASSNGTWVNDLENWPPYSLLSPYMANLNETGGVEVHTSTAQFNHTSIEGPGLRNDFRIVDAYSWEASRGVRCDFWRSIAGIVPE